MSDIFYNATLPLLLSQSNSQKSNSVDNLTLQGKDTLAVTMSSPATVESPFTFEIRVKPRLMQQTSQVIAELVCMKYIYEVAPGMGSFVGLDLVKCLFSKAWSIDQSSFKLIRGEYSATVYAGKLNGLPPSVISRVGRIEYEIRCCVRDDNAKELLHSTSSTRIPVAPPKVPSSIRTMFESKQFDFKQGTIYINYPTVFIQESSRAAFDLLFDCSSLQSSSIATVSFVQSVIIMKHSNGLVESAGKRHLVKELRCISKSRVTLPPFIEEATTAINICHWLQPTWIANTQLAISYHLFIGIKPKGLKGVLLSPFGVHIPIEVYNRDMQGGSGLRRMASFESDRSKTTLIA